jgi:hypothetical protein
MPDGKRMELARTMDNSAKSKASFVEGLSELLVNVTLFRWAASCSDRLASWPKSLPSDS